MEWHLGNIDNVPLGAFFGVDPVTGINNYNNGATLPSTFSNLNQYRPYSNYAGIALQSHGSYANYNAFIATWQKQSGRVTFTTNYTFSKTSASRREQRQWRASRPVSGIRST